MMRALTYLWRHPRRTGFLLFNLVVFAILLAWAGFTDTMSHEGIAGVPNVILGYTGMAIIWAALLGGWIAWAVMVASRHARLSAKNGTASPVRTGDPQIHNLVL